MSTRAYELTSTRTYGQYFSPYLAMGNNPVSLIDPDGGEAQQILGDREPPVESRIKERVDPFDMVGAGGSLSAAYSNYDDFSESQAFESWAGSGEGDYQRMVVTEATIKLREIMSEYIKGQDKSNPNTTNPIDNVIASIDNELAIQTLLVFGNTIFNDGYDIDAAVNYLNINSLEKSVGRCAFYVRMALEAGGINTNPHPVSAKNYGPYLENWGFTKVGKSGYIPQMGDIRVFQPYSNGNSHGHIDMYNGSQWLSDFREKNAYPGAGYKNSDFEIYRWGTYP